MTNFSGISRQGLWSWLTPERAVLVVPVFAGLGLSMALLSVGVTPLTIRVREQNEGGATHNQAKFVPVLRQQLAAVKREQVAGPSSWIACWIWWREPLNSKPFTGPQRFVLLLFPSPPQAWGSRTF